MLRPRIIPCLLLRGGAALVKTEKFRDPRYVGDPLNAIRIFNEKEVDELVLLDITATAEGREPDCARPAELAGECFMPAAYGGGLNSLDVIGRVLAAGFEKVVLGTAACADPELVRAAAREFGSQSIVVCIDVKRNWRGQARAVCRNARQDCGLDAVAYARRMAELGAGELLLQAVDRDGTMRGYDLDLVREVAAGVVVPVIAAGGAGSHADLRAALDAGASSAAAGSIFVYYGPHRAVLISYPDPEEVEKLLA